MFSARLWELYNYFSCGKVIKTAFFFCVPDYCTLHLFGRKIKWWRTISDSLSLVCFEQLERRDGEVQSRCSWNFFFTFFSGYCVKYDKTTYCPKQWVYFFQKTLTWGSVDKEWGADEGGSNGCFHCLLAIWRSVLIFSKFCWTEEETILFIVIHPFHSDTVTFHRNVEKYFSFKN